MVIMSSDHLTWLPLPSRVPYLQKGMRSECVSVSDLCFPASGSVFPGVRLCVPLRQALRSSVSGSAFLCVRFCVPLCWALFPLCQAMYSLCQALCSLLSSSVFPSFRLCVGLCCPLCQDLFLCVRLCVPTVMFCAPLCQLLCSHVSGSVLPCVSFCVPMCQALCSPVSGSVFSCVSLIANRFVVCGGLQFCMSPPLVHLAFIVKQSSLKHACTASILIFDTQLLFTLRCTSSDNRVRIAFRRSLVGAIEMFCYITAE